LVKASGRKEEAARGLRRRPRQGVGRGWFGKSRQRNAQFRERSRRRRRKLRLVLTALQFDLRRIAALAEDGGHAIKGLCETMANGSGQRRLEAIGEKIHDREDDDRRSRGLLQAGNVPRGRCLLGTGELQPSRNFSGAFVQAFLESLPRALAGPAK
jgi:hypothetical protein